MSENLMTKTYELIVQVLETQIEIERAITVASELGLGPMESCDRNKLIDAVINYFGPPTVMQVKDYERIANDAWLDVLEHRISIRAFVGLIASFCTDPSSL